MDCSNNLIETTVGCDSLCDNNNISSVTNENPTKNMIQESSDDFMFCDDWVNYYEPSANDNNPNTVDQIDGNPDEEMSSVTKCFPPKNNNRKRTKIATNTFYSSKNYTDAQKPVDMDKILEHLDYNILYLNLRKLHQFLESTHEEMCFPFISKKYEEFFKMIALDVNILKSKSLDLGYRDICDKIMYAINMNKSVYLLTSAFEYRKDFRDVLVFKKINLKKEHVMSETSLSRSLESLPPPSESATKADTTKVLKRSTIRPTISKGFKIHVLKATLAFVKHSEMSKIEFPELSTDQAEFMTLLLKGATASSDFDKTIEIEDLYRSLWEAVKIYSLKYEFRINSVETWGERKSLVFEKVLKQKSAEPGDNSSQQKSLAFEKIMTPEATAGVLCQITNQKTRSLSEKKTKKLTKKELKRFQIVDFVNSLPPPFVIETLSTIKDFLSIEDTGTIVFVPANEYEQKFYRNIPHWARMTMQCSGPIFEGEYKRLFEAIGLLLISMICKIPNKGFKRDAAIGTKEVIYIKRPKFPAPEAVPNTPQSLNTEKNNKRKNSINSDTDRSVTSVGKSVRKRKKLKLKNVVNADGTIEITVTNPNGSIRKKKKNKKQKHAKLVTTNDKLASVGISNKISFKPANQDGLGTDGSASERAISMDRTKPENDPQSVPKKSPKEIIKNIRASIGERERRSMRGRHANELQRKEQLIEALSVPVQSDKAMKMMRGMGWSGGALGARGNGITEPIMPAIDILTGAGFGHTKNSTKLVNVAKTVTAPKTVGNWLTESSDVQNQTPKPETDIIVLKTKQLLLENHSFDSLVTLGLTKPNLVFYKACNFRKDVLNNILELLSSDLTNKTLKYKATLSKKDRGFLKHATRVLGARSKLTLAGVEQELVDEICAKYSELPGVLIQGIVSLDYKEIQLNKVQTFSDDQMKQLNDKQKNYSEANFWATPISEVDDDNTITFIDALRPTCPSKKAFRALKFRVLILLKILYFTKSDDEELEVMFNKVLPAKQKSYIESTIETVNSRIRPGNSPAESALGLEIKNYIGDTFFGIMFNHHYTSFTLIKYSRSKRPNNSTKDSQKKRKCTSINLDGFSCDNSNEAIVNTVKENIKATENNNNEVVNIGHADINKKDIVATDNLNKDATVRNIGDTDTANDWVNLKKNYETTVVKDNSIFYFNFKADSDTGENKNIPDPIKNKQIKTDDKNNSAKLKASEITGNGNVVVDNNDNQVIDMKNDIIVYKENIIIETEKVNNNAVNVMEDEVPAKTDVDKSEININEKFDDKTDEEIENSKIEVFPDSNDGGKIQRNKHNEILMSDNNREIDNISIDTMTEEILLNDDQGDDDFISSDDSASNCDRTENANNDFINILEDTVMKEVNITKEDNIDDSRREIGIDGLKIINKDDNSSKQYSVNTPSMKEDIVADNNEIVVTIGSNCKHETDCDKVLNQNIVLSEVHCDNEQLGVSDFGKVFNEKYETVDPRNFEMGNNLLKYSEIKNVYLVPISYPNVKLTNQKAREIQKLISDNIPKTKELPLLMCHGFQNGALIYTCHNIKTLDWLKNTINVASEFKVLDTKKVRKMALKFYCLFDFDTKYLFSMIELYNKELSTKEWVVEKSEFYDGYAIFLVKMDEYSINFIHASDLALFAGVDKVEFSLIWG